MWGLTYVFQRIPVSHPGMTMDITPLQPTRVRYNVIFASMLMAILLYLDRFCIGIAEPFIRQDLGLSKI